MTDEQEQLSDAEQARLSAVWTALGAARPARTVSNGDRDALWSAISAATAGSKNEQVAGQIRPAAGPRWRYRPLYGVAAAAALLIAAAIGAAPDAHSTVNAPLATVTPVTLPDGSTVELDAGSTIRYRPGFRGWFGRPADRTIRLNGSAYFAVTTTGAPFVVETYNAAVEVLGTQFAVNARADESTGTRVAVAEGRVRVRGIGSPGSAPSDAADTDGANADAARNVQLAAGERTLVRHDAYSPDAAVSVPLDRVAPWRVGGLVAIDEPLRTVLRQLERQYSTTIALADPTIGDRRITLYFAERTALERILSDVAIMQELQWERTREGFLLR